MHLHSLVLSPGDNYSHHSGGPGRTALPDTLALVTSPRSYAQRCQVEGTDLHGNLVLPEALLAASLMLLLPTDECNK